MSARRAVFLDRDGVLNRALLREGRPHAPGSLDELEILEGVPQALAQLRAAGFLNVVVTNQPDVGAGRMPRGAVEEIHRHLLETFPIDAVRACFHTDADACACRKPKPGMLLDAAREMGIDLAKSVLVGDRWRDVGAAQAAGCRAYFVDLGYAEKRPEKPYVAVKSLPEAVAKILRFRQEDP